MQELGADRVCAEWVVRCGGAVRFTNWGSLISNVKSLPTGTPGQFRIEEIRAVKASMTSEGFAYLGSLVFFSLSSSFSLYRWFDKFKTNSFRTM